MPSPDDKDNGEGDKAPPIDWGEVYARLLDIGLRYDEIQERSFKQILVLLGEWAEITSLKISMPNIFGGSLHSPTNNENQNTDSPPKLSQFMSFANAFNEI